MFAQLIVFICFDFSSFCLFCRYLFCYICFETSGVSWRLCFREQLDMIMGRHLEGVGFGVSSEFSRKNRSFIININSNCIRPTMGMEIIVCCCPKGGFWCGKWRFWEGDLEGVARKLLDRRSYRFSQWLCNIHKSSRCLLCYRVLLSLNVDVEILTARFGNGRAKRRYTLTLESLHKNFNTSLFTL